MVDTAVILAGGLATRLRPITEKIPKSLVAVAGQPFIFRQLDLLRRNGIKEIILLVGFLGEQIEQLVGDGSGWGLSVKYSYDGPAQLGTGGAIRQARTLLKDTFWVLYGDSYLDFDYRAVSAFFERESAGKAGLMTVFGNQNKWDRSNVIFEGGQLLKYDKWTQVPEMHYIDYGAAILKREALDHLPPTGAYDLSDLYTGLVNKGLLLGCEVTQRFYEVGSPAGLEEADRFFRQKEQQKDAEG